SPPRGASLGRSAPPGGNACRGTLRRTSRSAARLPPEDQRSLGRPEPIAERAFLHDYSCPLYDPETSCPASGRRDLGRPVPASLRRSVRPWSEQRIRESGASD